MTVYIGQIGDADKNQWDEYLLSVPNRLPMNSYAWKEILERAYGVETVFWAARDETGRICGVLPTYITSGFKGVKNIISLKGGLVAESNEIAYEMIECLDAWRGQLKNSNCLITSGSVQLNTPFDSIVRNTMVIEIYEREEDQWNSLRGKTRNMLRKAYSAGLKTERGFDNLDVFYNLYRSVMQENKVRPVSRQLFDVMQVCLGSDMELITASKNGEIVGGIILLFGTDLGVYPWQASNARTRDFATNQFLIWEAMNSCRERGVSMLDMGECVVDGSVYLFKKNFGGQPRDVYYFSSDADLAIKKGFNILTYGVQAAVGRMASKSASLIEQTSPQWVRSKVENWIKSKGRII